MSTNDTTKAARFTAGPWRVQDNTDLEGDGHQVRVDSDGGAVAVCGAAPFVDDEMRANAYLIAASPALYALAVKVAEHFANTDAPLGAEARSALAAARGEA